MEQPLVRATPRGSARQSSAREGAAREPELVPFGPYYARHFREMDPAALQSIHNRFPQRSANTAREHEVFSVALSRKGSDLLGFDLDFTDGFSARLTKVETKGAVVEWNKRCPQSLRVLQGDHIVAVNGKRGNARAIMQRLQSDEALDIEVHRPAQITIRVNTARGGLGIDTNQAKNAKSLMITNVVSGGAIYAWNAANEDRVVEKYDRVVAVNGFRGSWKELSAKVRESQEQELVLLIAKAPPTVQRLAEISAATVDQLVQRGTSVRQLLQFYAACKRRGTVDGATTSLEVLRNVVVPETALRPCCYMESEFMRRLGGPRRATRIVSHRRSAPFTNLVTNIILDATGWSSEDLAQAAFGQYSMRRVSDQPPAECVLQAEGLLRTLPGDVLDSSYWISLFAVDVHRSECGDCPRCRSTEAWKRDPVAHLRAGSAPCGTAKRIPCLCGTEKVPHDRPDCETNKFGAIAKRMDSVMLSLDPGLNALRSPRVVAEVSVALRLRPVRFRLAFALRQDGLNRLTAGEELVPAPEQNEADRPRRTGWNQQEQFAGGLASATAPASASDRLVSCIAGLKFGGCRGAAALPDDARRDLEKVKHLEMDFSWLGTGLKDISDSLGNTAALDALQLESLQVVLDRCKEVHDLGALGEALRGQAELRSLDASFRFCYKLGDSSLASLATGLPESLTDLGLNFCFCVRVGDEGLSVLAEQLPGSLRRLQLNFASCDGLTDSGVASLARRLPPGLRSLDLTFSWIGDGGMSALAAGMPAALEELEIKCSLGNVNLTDRGLAALASRLPGGLQRINLTLAHTGASMAAQSLGSSVQGLRDWRPKAQPADPAPAWPDGPSAYRLADDDPPDAKHVVAKRAVAF